LKLSGKYAKRVNPNKKQRYVRKEKSKKRDAIRAALHKMDEYDRGVELCPAKQVLLDRKNLAPCVVIFDLETAGFRREQDILQVTYRLYFLYFWVHAKLFYIEF
jgi:hypothetical protein